MSQPSLDSVAASPTFGSYLLTHFTGTLGTFEYFIHADGPFKDLYSSKVLVTISYNCQFDSIVISNNPADYMNLPPEANYTAQPAGSGLSPLFLNLTKDIHYTFSMDVIKGISNNASAYCPLQIYPIKVYNVYRHREE